MKVIPILLKKEFLSLKKKCLSFLLVTILFPLFIYLFISLPLSAIVIDLKPIYPNWSAAGIWAVTSLIFIYIFSFRLYNKTFGNQSMIVLPIPSYYLLLSNYLFLALIGLFQLSITMFIIGMINNDYIGFLDYMLTIIIVVPVFFIVASISLFIYFFIKNKIILPILNIIFFCLVSFGYGSFIPLKYFPPTYIDFIKYFPIPGMIENFQNIISGKPIIFSYLIISLFSCCLIFLISIFIVDKKVIKNI